MLILIKSWYAQAATLNFSVMWCDSAPCWRTEEQRSEGINQSSSLAAFTDPENLENKRNMSALKNYSRLTQGQILILFHVY